MLCPFCRTENRDERDACYNCEKDLTMLRLLVNKAKSHFNTALELAERDRHDEAIAELHNALDLDHSHVNSHVVLGTLYAKIGQLDKAVTCWQEALRLDPRLEKAHDYIEKAELARRSLPLVRRQRLLIVAFVVIVAVLAGILVVQNQPDPGPARLAEAWEAYANGNHAKALTVIRQVFNADEGRTTMAAQLAGALQSVVLKEEDLQIAAAREALEREHFAEARAKALEIMARNPSPEGTRRIEKILEGTLEAARARVEKALLDVQERRAAPGDALDAIEALDSLDAPDQERFLAAARNQLAATVRTFRIERALQSFEQGQTDVWNLLGELARLRNDYPDYELLNELTVRFATPVLAGLRETGAEQIGSRDVAGATETLRLLNRLQELSGLKDISPVRSELLQAIEQSTASSIESALSANRIEDARNLLNVLKDLASDRVPELASRVESAELDARLAGLRQAAGASSHEQVVEMGTEILNAPAMTDEIRAEVEKTIESARQRLAERHYKWMLDRDWRYYYDQLSEEDARTTLEYYPTVSNHLSMRAYPHSPPRLMFFAAMAHRKLGDDLTAQTMLREVRDNYSNSSVVQYVGRYLTEGQAASEETTEPTADAPETDS